MKKVAALFTVVLLLLIWACGGSDKTEQTEEKSEALDTQEAMVQALKDLNIEIPAELQFESVRKNSIDFKAKSTDAALKQKLDEFYTGIRTNMKSKGFEESANMINNQNLGGIIKTSYRFKRPIVGSNRSDILDASVDYIESTGDYILHLSYYPKY
jgi:major membrane immunogen (membrane-anchored lipoprotein)